MSRKSLDFSALVILLVVIFYSDFRDMGLSEMNSTHLFGYETTSKQCRIIEFVGCDLIVKSLFQGVNRGGEKFYNASYATAGVFGILEKGQLKF